MMAEDWWFSMKYFSILILFTYLAHQDKIIILK
jgi:hypothetical protein